MTEQPPQSDPQDENLEEQADLEDQLDELVSQIDPPDPARPASGRSDQADAGPSPAVAVPPAGGAGTESEPTRDDASALDDRSAMAPDDAETGEAPKTVFKPPTAQASSVDRMIDQQIDETIALVEQQTVAVDAAAIPGSAKEGSAPAGARGEPEPIGQIDQMLADQADEAMSGDFETVTDLLEEPSPAEEDLDGAFQAPEQLEGADELAGTTADDQHAAPVSAGAAEVAAELDSQPEDLPAAAPMTPRGVAAAMAAGPVKGKAVINLAAIRAAERALKRICAVINSPVMRLSPEWRDTIGWIALAVAPPAIVLVLYGLVT